MRSLILGLLITALATGIQAQEISTWVTAPDGVLLATDIYLPLTGRESPTVLIRTTYDKNDLQLLCFAFNILGYSCAAQDTRGRYASGGQDTVFRNDGDDGRATIAWIAEQPWTTGSIATVGASALGITQYALMPDAPEALRCTMPIVATPDMYHHAFMQGGALRSALVTNWLDGQDAPEFLEQILEHRLWDEWWDAVDPMADPSLIDVPSLHIGGWYDIFGQGTLDAFSRLKHDAAPEARDRQYLIMGPWTHSTTGTNNAGELVYPANAILDITSITQDWLDYCLEQRTSAIDDWAPVNIYLMGAVGEPNAPGNQWISLNDWPPRSAATPYFLGEDGSLATSASPAGSRLLDIDPGAPVPTLGGANLFPDMEVEGRPMGAGPFDQRPIESRDDVLVFSSAPLSEPVTILGRVSCRLWIAPDTPDIDLAVRLSDVYPDGRSMLVVDGIQRARMRCGDDQECFLRPGEPTEIIVDLWSTALVVNAGHRIRISVSGSNSPRFEINPNDGGDLDMGTAIPARPALLFGPENPSALELPVVPSPRRPRGRHQNSRPPVPARS